MQYKSGTNAGLLDSLLPKTIFDTCLYHTKLCPQTITAANLLKVKLQVYLCYYIKSLHAYNKYKLKILIVL